MEEEHVQFPNATGKFMVHSHWNSSESEVVHHCCVLENQLFWDSSERVRRSLETKGSCGPGLSEFDMLRSRIFDKPTES